MSSFSLPAPHPPSADASGALASPTPAFAVGSGRRWMVLPRLQHLPGSHAGASYREPRPCARCCCRQPGRRGSAVSPAQPARTAPQTCRPPRWGCACRRVGAAAAWLQRGCFGVFSWLVAPSAFGKLQSQQPAGREGASNRDARTLTCGHFARKQQSPDAGRTDGGPSAGVGAEGGD